MALVSTTTTTDLTATGRKVTVASASGFAVGQITKIDGEFQGPLVAINGTILTLGLRGYNGTASVAHDLLSTITTTATASDWTSPQMGVDTDRPPFVSDVISVGENGTIDCPTRDTTIMLTKATALATTTLADPPKDRDGLQLVVTSATDAAHVITGNFADGTTGAHTTLTCAAFNGASALLVAQQGLWNVIGTEGITVG